METQRGLIIGGCGFIGSNIVNLLDHEWTVVDDLSLGVRENLQKGTHFRKLSADEINWGVGQGNYDFIMLQHGPSSNPMFYPDPYAAIEKHTLGAVRVFDFARRVGINKVIYASTSSLYGNTPGLQSEDSPIRPPNFYSVAKRAIEDVARVYWDAYGISSFGFRYFSVYGANEGHKGEYANIITQFLWRLLDGEPPIIYGNGKQTRDFTHVKDVVDANKRAIDSCRAGAFVLNVGTGKAASFNRVADLLNDEMHMTILPQYVPNRINNYVNDTLADTRLAKEVLGFESKVDLGEGVKRLIAAYTL